MMLSNKKCNQKQTDYVSIRDRKYICVYHTKSDFAYYSEFVKFVFIISSTNIHTLEYIVVKSQLYYFLESNI